MYREQEFTRKLEMAMKTRMRGYEDEMVKEDDLVYYQTENKKAWQGPVKVFTVKGNSVCVIANGDTRKIPRCNVMLFKKNKDELSNDDETEKIEEKIKVVNKEKEKDGVRFEEKENHKNDNRRITR